MSAATRAVFFDLDGTFADTAPDLTYALNVMREARGLPPCPIELAPCYDAASQLVYAAGAQHVTHVWVDGKARVTDGKLVGIDERELQLKALHWKDRIKA